MPDGGHPLVEHLFFGEVVLEFTQRLQLKPGDLRPSAEADLMPAGARIAAIRIDAFVPGNREIGRVGRIAQAGRGPEARFLTLQLVK